VAAFLELSFELGTLDAESAADAGVACGASAVTFVDALDETPDLVATPVYPTVLEPAPGELRLWPATRVRCLFSDDADRERLRHALATALGIDAALIECRDVADRAWEREWLKDSRAVCFGRRLWVCPHHERVSAPGAVVVYLDPGLAFGTGTHPSTALCLRQLDAHLAAGVRLIDYGCGSGVLALAAAKLGAAEVHAFDIDPQALTATADNALANGVSTRVTVHAAAETLPGAADVLVANILSRTLCALAPRFASLVRPRGQLLLAGLMEHETAEVTEAYAACFDVARVADCDGWVCLAGSRR
jgi:ribosomal protein L11 methyltransferase